MTDPSGRTTVVVGASRGLGRGVARAFAEAGAPVVAVARAGPALTELAATSPNIRTEIADAVDPAVAWNLVDQYEPEVLVLVAGANPVTRPLQYHTWETFSVNWHTDVKIAFTWRRAAEAALNTGLVAAVEQASGNTTGTAALIRPAPPCPFTSLAMGS